VMACLLGFYCSIHFPSHSYCHNPCRELLVSDTSTVRVALLDGGGGIGSGSGAITRPLIPLPPSHHRPPRQTVSSQQAATPHTSTPPLSTGCWGSEAYVTLRSDSLLTRAHSGSALSPEQSLGSLASSQSNVLAEGRGEKRGRPGEAVDGGSSSSNRRRRGGAPGIRRERCQLVQLSCSPPSAEEDGNDLEPCPAPPQPLPPSIYDLLAVDPSLMHSTMKAPSLCMVCYRPVWAVFVRSRSQDEVAAHRREVDDEYFTLLITSDAMSTLLGNIPAALVWHCHRSQNSKHDVRAGGGGSSASFDYSAAAERVYQALRDYTTHTLSNGDSDTKTSFSSHHFFDVVYEVVKEEPQHDRRVVGVLREMKELLLT
jgi:hypothetical protein